MNTTYDVMICGAGPVGLFLACELALAECSVLVLEKAEQPDSLLKQLPFGTRGLSSLSVEALDRRGLLQQLEVPRRLKNPFGDNKSVQAGHFAGIAFQYPDIDTAQWPYRLPGSTPTNLLAEMQELESVLTRRASALGVRILRGHAITECQQSADVVSVQANNQSFQGRWLVGCDGARSMVRKLARFDFAGTEPEFTGYTTRVDIADPEKLSPGRTMTPRGMYFQSQPGYLAMQDFDGGAFHNGEEPVTLAHLQSVLRRISGTDVTLSALHTATTWTDRARQASSYRDRRILLAGDAAHIHSPLGGQGLNLGLGDAMNLGWKLAATLNGTAPDGLLDSYHDERHPVGAQVLDWSRAQVAAMRPGPEGQALHAIFRDLVGTRDGATYFAARVWGIFTRYDLGAGHPLAGLSVPNFEYEDGTRVGDLMHGGRALLLDFTGDAARQACAAACGERVQYVAARVRESLGISALLVRPDGTVAWATDEATGHDGLPQALARWFSPAA